MNDWRGVSRLRGFLGVVFFARDWGAVFRGFVTFVRVRGAVFRGFATFVRAGRVAGLQEGETGTRPLTEDAGCPGLRAPAPGVAGFRALYLTLVVLSSGFLEAVLWDFVEDFAVLRGRTVGTVFP